MPDKRKKYYIMLDTETCPLDKDFEGVAPFNMFVYDLGFAVVDKRGNVYESYSFVVKDIFFAEAELMKSAYYANKIPRYVEDIKAGFRKVATWFEIHEILIATMEKYNTNIVIAHNARFDDGAIKNTQRWLTKSKYRYFFPKNTIVWDTLKMAKAVIAPMPTYRAFCEAHGYMTKHAKPRPQLKAETIFRFLTANTDFIESHTGLEDVMIEKEIFRYCMGKHKPMPKALYAKTA